MVSKTMSKWYDSIVHTGRSVESSCQPCLALNLPKFFVNRKSRPTLANKSGVVDFVIGQKGENSKGSSLGLGWHGLSKVWQSGLWFSRFRVALLAASGRVKLYSHGWRLGHGRGWCHDTLWPHLARTRGRWTWWWWVHAMSFCWMMWMMVSSRSHGHAHRWVSHHHGRSHVVRWWMMMRVWSSWSRVHHVMWHSSGSHGRWSWVATTRIGIRLTLSGTHWHTRWWFALPSFICNSHGKVGTTLILDLASLVNQCLRSSKVQTFDTLALGSAECTSLEALAVLFETS
mmetsp:Transcript_33795/g.81933  ORF Transcript_33795/g.81933 Transcript_33795/m.81933 type:complete len:286 (+) Transcript_33795:204-1061(+)